MKAKITQAFRFAVGGLHVVDVSVGDVVDGRCAEVALQEKWGLPADAPPPPAPAPVAVPPPPPAPAPVASDTAALKDWTAAKGGKKKGR